MKILLAASESVPFCKTGGLADVVGTLARKLGEAGHDLCLFLPRYREIPASALTGAVSSSVLIPFAGGVISATLRFVQWKSVAVYFVDYPPFYDRDGLYGWQGRDHADNDRRFAFFCRAIIEGAKSVGFKPDIIHLHDWQTGLTVAHLKKHYAGDVFFADTASVFTVHNLAYQGNFPYESFISAGFSSKEFTPESLEYHGQASFLKAGLVYADALTTVSATYAREIQVSSERGFGMEGLLRRRSADLHGILNGIDLEVWDPARDPFLTQVYSAHAFKLGKARNKQIMQKEGKLEKNTKYPLIGIVARLDYQKGLDLAIAAIEPRLDRCQLMVVGTGEASLQKSFAALAQRRTGRVYFHNQFDEAFGHRVYAAADIFLMPSRFEPCGLGQLIAMRYGAVPVVSRTGGLADTVVEQGTQANGFLVEPGDAEDLGRGLDRALACYGSAQWPDLVRTGMEGDFSWDKSVAAYLDVYRSISKVTARL